jgi:hypothetical protein
VTRINHRRTNRKPVDERYPTEAYHNGHACIRKERGITQVGGNTGFLNKSMQGWGRVSKFADVCVGAGIGNDFSNGHRGMAKAVRGAKKFVRTRFRFYENQAVRKLMSRIDEQE